MAQFVNIYPCDLRKGPVETSLKHMYLGDVEANRVGVNVTDGGEAVALSGTCSGTAILCNGGTVALTGVISGNQAYIDMPAAVYTVEGPVEIYLAVTTSGVTTTLLHGHGNAVRTDSGIVIDPGTIIPSVAALISDIDAAVASIPEDYSELSADVVQLKSDMEDVQPAVETLEDDVADLKGAINDTDTLLELKIITSDDFELGNMSISTSGWSYSNNTSRIRTKQGTTIRLNKGDTISFVTGASAQFCIGWLNDNGIYNTTTSWITSYVCDVTANYVLLVRLNPETTISDVGDVFDLLKIDRNVNVMSIKEDKSNISGIKSHIKVINDLVGIYNPKESDFEIGNISISSSGWSYGDKDSRVRTKSGTTISLKKGDIISLTDYTDARMYIGYQKKDGTYGGDGWLTDDYSCMFDGDYVILLCHSSDKRLNSVDELLSLLLIFTKSGEDEDESNSKIPLKYDKKKMELTWVGASGTNKRINAEYEDVSEYKCISYTIPSGYEVGVKFYDENRTLFRDTGWDTTGLGYRLCGGAKYATLVIRKSNETAITPSDITDSFVFELFGHKMYSYVNSPVYTIFHRGCDNTAPENTEISYIYAAKERAFYVETDIRYTSDGVPVLLHDETINRTGRNADGTSIATTINIADITYEDALDYDFGIYKGNNFAGQKILTFEQFMSLCSAYELHPVVELKGGITANRVKDLYKTALKYGMKGRISWIGTPGDGILDALTEIDDEVDFYWLTSLTSENVTDAIGYKTSKNRIHMDIYITLSSTLDQSLIDQATEGGVEIAVWMANAESQLKYLFGLRGVTGYTTDGTDAVIGLLMEHQP